MHGGLVVGSQRQTPDQLGDLLVVIDHARQVYLLDLVLPDHLQLRVPGQIGDLHLADHVNLPSAMDRLERVGLDLYPAELVAGRRKDPRAQPPDLLAVGLTCIHPIRSGADLDAARESDVHLQLLAVHPGRGQQGHGAGQIFVGERDEVLLLRVILDQLFKGRIGLAVVLLLVIADAQPVLSLRGDGLAGFGFGDHLLVEFQGGINIAFGFLRVDALLQQLGGRGGGGDLRRREEAGDRKQEQRCAGPACPNRERIYCFHTPKPTAQLLPAYYQHIRCLSPPAFP